MNLEELERPLGGGVGARLVSLDGSEGAQPDTTQPGRHVPVASAAADADTQRPDCADEAGESVASVHRAIRRYEHAGLAGVHIEDEIDPKHSVWDGPLLPITDLQARVETAVNARRSDEFVIIVRSNEFQVDNGGGTGSLDEMIQRAVAAADAGADAFIPTFADEQQLAAIAAEVDLPLGGYQSLIPGLQFTLFTGWGVAGCRARTPSHRHAHLRRTGTCRRTSAATSTAGP